MGIGIMRPHKDIVSASAQTKDAEIRAKKLCNVIYWTLDKIEAKKDRD
jgi:hypothetical protein